MTCVIVWTNGRITADWTARLQGAFPVVYTIGTDDAKGRHIVSTAKTATAALQHAVRHLCTIVEWMRCVIFIASSHAARHVLTSYVDIHAIDQGYIHTWGVDLVCGAGRTTCLAFFDIYDTIQRTMHRSECILPCFANLRLSTFACDDTATGARWATLPYPEILFGNCAPGSVEDMLTVLDRTSHWNLDSTDMAFASCSSSLQAHPHIDLEEHHFLLACLNTAPVNVIQSTSCAERALVTRLVSEGVVIDETSSALSLVASTSTANGTTDIDSEGLESSCSEVPPTDNGDEGDKHCGVAVSVVIAATGAKSCRVTFLYFHKATATSVVR